MKKERNIAITIQNFVQFYSIKKVIDEIIDNGLKVDIYVPIAKDSWGVKEMFDDIYQHLLKLNYSVKRKPSNKKYKILLEPYPMDYYFTFNYEYRIKYKYSIISAKPFPTYRECDNFCYDAILCYSTYEAEILSNYSQTYIVGKPMYSGFKKAIVKKDKPILLYLPTYGDLNSIVDISDEVVKLKEHFKVITKAHHGTNYFDYESNKIKILNNMFDEFYDSSMPLDELLKISDVVLSDNSGSIFEALYTGVPVAVFSKNLEECSLNGFDSYQYRLIKEKVIPYTSSSNEILKILNEALSKKIINKQECLSRNIFPLKGKKGLNAFLIVINNYLNDNVPKDKLKLHRLFLEEYKTLKKQLESAMQVNNEIVKLNTKMIELNYNKIKLEDENKLLKYQLNEYKQGKLYKFSTKFYSFIGKLRRSNNEK